MDKLKEILAKAVKERNADDLKYLEEHKSELNDEMKKQLDDEKNILEEHTAFFVEKGIADRIKEAKEKGKYQTRAFNAVAKDLGNGMMEAVISSEALDRHGEKIDMKGMNIKEYMEFNPIIADGHDYSKPSVGRTHKLKKTQDGKLIAVFEWAKDISDRARELYLLYANKFQFAFSIGFMVEDMQDNVFTKSTMLEFSPVLIPANPEARLLMKQKGLDTLNFINYNEVNMYKLKDIVEKGLKDSESLTVGEVKFLKEHASELTDEQKSAFAALIEEKKIKVDASAVKEEIEKAVEGLKKELEALKDPVKPKNINLHYNAKATYENASEEMKKKFKFLYYVRGVQANNFSKYEEIVGKDAMNTTDDGVVLPPQEFITEIQRLEETYGVSLRDASVVRSTNGSGIKYLFGNDDVEIFDTAESGAKQSSKNSYTSKTLLWRKFAGILPITDELSEDSAVRLWEDATNRFARAFAKKKDELVFTESSAVSPKNKGVLYVAGTNQVVMSGTGSDDDFSDVEYDDLVNMLTGVPTASQANGKFYFHRTLLGTIMKLKDTTGRPLWLPAMAGGAPATILGRPYELVEVLPSISDSAPNTPFMVFGDLRYVTLGERTDVQIKIFDSGSVGDPDEDDQEANQINLLTQDAQAMRAVQRMNAVVRFPSAFSVLLTGNPSS